MKFQHFVSKGANQIVEAGYHCGERVCEVHSNLHKAGFKGITPAQTQEAMNAYVSYIEDELDVYTFIRSLPLRQDHAGQTYNLRNEQLLGEFGMFLEFCGVHAYRLPCVTAFGVSEWPASTRDAWFGWLGCVHGRELGVQRYRADRGIPKREPKGVDTLRSMIAKLVNR